MKNIKRIALVCVAALMTSCTFDANFRAYVTAHDLAYKATRPHYEVLLEADTTTSVADKATIKRRLDAEAKMIADAKELLGAK